MKKNLTMAFSVGITFVALAAVFAFASGAENKTEVDGTDQAVDLEEAELDEQMEEFECVDEEKSALCVNELLQDSNVWYNNGRVYYPVTPESEVWTELTLSDAFKVTNIPIAIVEDLETAELLQLFFEYPFAGDFMAFNDFNNGFETIRARCNVLDELMNRDDLYDTLMACDTSFSDKNSSTYDFVTAEIWKGLVNYVIYSVDLDESQIESLESVRT